MNRLITLFEVKAKVEVEVKVKVKVEVEVNKKLNLIKITKLAARLERSSF
jgi:hypothetical protein